MLSDKNVLVHGVGVRCDLSQGVTKCEANHRAILFSFCFLKGFTTFWYREFWPEAKQVIM